MSLVMHDIRVVLYFYGNNLYICTKNHIARIVVDRFMISWSWVQKKMDP
jgi:hypothetical protein